MGRVLGVDLGSRRIGLALSDPNGRVATPHAVIERSGDPAVDRRKILAHAREAGASRVVVGLPLSLSGDVGPAAAGFHAFCDRRGWIAAFYEVEAARPYSGIGMTTVPIGSDAVVPVPLHPSRAVARGYDQAALLARAIAARVGLPVRAALHRIRGGRPQVELDRAARAANIRGAFVAEVSSLRGLRVAIVDDVATTGATLSDAAAAARAAGARAVCAYVVAVEE